MPKKSVSLNPFTIIKYCFILLTLLLPFSASAYQPEQKKRPVETRIVGGAAVKLHIPEKYCPLKRTNPKDMIMFEGINASLKGENDLLVLFAECQELKKWRSGTKQYLDHFGNYQITAALSDIDMRDKESATIKEVCSIYQKQGVEVFEEMTPAINRRLANGFQNIQINQMKMLGIIHEDKTQCIITSYQKLKTDDGNIKNQLAILSISILNGRMIFTYLYAPYNDKKATLNHLLKRASILNRQNQNRNKKIR